MTKRSVKLSATIFLLFALLPAAYADTPAAAADFAEYTLQNGMRVFILEDTSSAPVRIEYTVRAGFSAQSAENAGFFPLYTRLFLNAGKGSYGQGTNDWIPSRAEASCTADSARYIVTVAPAETERALSQLAQCAFAPVFGDTELQVQFSALKTEVMNYAFSTAGFINSSIDARVFSDAPWKQDTGVYPALFTNIPSAQARTILSSISKTYYVPRNSALFISGGIDRAAALSLAERTFSPWPAGTVATPQDATKTGIPGPDTNQQRRFVIYDPLFSADITQIVVQYTGLSMPQADTAAAVFNAGTSSFKQSLLSHKELGIRGTEYINTAAAHKNGLSRLIFQSILEKTPASPDKQAALFIDCVKKAADSMESTEFQQTCQELSANVRSLYTSSAAVMNTLSELWAVENNGQYQTDDTPLFSRLLARPGEIASLDSGALCAAYDSEEPFVFVLVNSAVYKKYADIFKQAGYEPVTQKNGSWYTRELYKNVTHTAAVQTSVPDSLPRGASYYVSRNDPQFSTFTLSNGIPVVLKQNELSETTLLMLSLSGGKLTGASNPGFFSISINALAGEIQKEINIQKKNGTIDGIPSVLAETDLTSGTITIESTASDMNVIIPCISRALIYGDIQPAQADGLIYDARTRKRLHDGDTVNQLYSRAVHELFPGTPYPAVFDSDSDILTDTKYTDILSSYPALLDASRYTLVVTGRFDEPNIHDLLETSLGVLASRSERNSTKPAVSVPEFPRDKKVTVRLRHLFLTDTSATDAGPQPAVLVPTKNFSDPVQYWIPSPAPGSPEFPLFNALIGTLRARLEKNAAALSPDITVRADSASSGIQAAVITLTHIDRTKQADTLYEKTAAQLCKDAEDPETWKTLAGEMLNVWLVSTLGGTQTNRGTAKLIHEGIETGQTGDILQDAKQYLRDYTAVSSASQEQTAAVCRTAFSSAAPLRLYSKDAAK